VATACAPRWRVWVTALSLLPAIAGGCARDVFRAETEGGLEVALAVEPFPPRVGDATVRARVTDREGGMVEGAQVQVFYWVPYKGVPAAPEQQVKSVEAVGKDGRYQAKVKLEKPGPWKIAVKVERPRREPELATFTVNVEGSG